MSFFWTKEHEVPPQVRDEIEKEFMAPDAKEPASNGKVGAIRVFFQEWLHAFEKGVRESLARIEKRLEAIDAKAQKVTDVERKMQAFDPLEFTDGELGTKTVIMHLKDGRTAIVTKEVQSADGEAPAARKARIDLMEKTIRDFRSELERVKQHGSTIHARVAALEKKAKAAAA